jgi:hypothetical protein
MCKSHQQLSDQQETMGQIKALKTPSSRTLHLRNDNDGPLHGRKFAYTTTLLHISSTSLSKNTHCPSNSPPSYHQITLPIIHSGMMRWHTHLCADVAGVSTKILQYSGCNTLPLPQQPQEQMLCAYIIVTCTHHPSQTFPE